MRKSGKPASSPQQRPLRGLDLPTLDAHFAAALTAGDGETGAHCIHERWMRGAFPAQIENAQEHLWKHAAASVPEWLPMHYVSWLPLAYEVAAQFSAARSGRSHIYLVLLEFPDRRGDPHGVYVGMSHYRAAQRFDQHKAGIRAAGSVLKRGLEVLTGPVLHLQYIARADAARIEVALAQALADAGLRVEGGH
jgi:hypothetical protein